MKKLNIIAFAGDGIGPEITAATLQVVEAANKMLDLGLNITHDDVGFAAYEKHGHTMPDATLEKARAADGVILGPCDTYGYPVPPEKGGVNPSSKLRLGLDLYANMRPSRTIKGVPAFVKQMDLVIARENTEGFYADRNMFTGSGEFMPTPEVALAVRKITASSSKRIAIAACEAAMKRRKQVTLVSKANVLKLSDGLFMREARAVCKTYPEIKVNEVLVDAMASLLVRTPEAYDVICTTNMFGDILSNQASELAGGLGLAGSLNAGDAHAMAQASHGSAPDIAGQDKANPCSVMFSTCMLLDWLGERHQMPALQKAGALIDHAICEVLAEPASRTVDLGGKLGTRAFGEAVVKKFGTLVK
ncbi:MAG: 3-isopropylmalate dehydrogenase [Betaproteobacteria bacterium]|nr:3-isopropylmalate dehydrogenase [Betaproteobacteria bacterium]